MRGRTNYTGGAMPVINGTIKNYEVAQGSTIKKGDFVELAWQHLLESFVGYRSSVIRYIKLSGGTHIFAIRADSGYQWYLYAVEFIDRKPIVKNIFNPVVGDGTIKSPEDLQLVSLEDNKFAYSAVRSDGYLGVVVALLKYNDETITVLSEQYYYDKDKSSNNPDYSPIVKCSNYRLVSTWGNYFMVMSYENDELVVLTEEVFKATGSNISRLYLNYFYVIPGYDDKFLCGKNHLDTASGEETFYLVELKEDNTIISLAFVENEYGGSKPMPHNFVFVTNKFSISISGYNNSSSEYSYNKFRLYNITSSSIARTSQTSSEQLSGMPSSRLKLKGGGAVASLNNGYFIMAEGVGGLKSGVLYLSFGYVSETGEILIIDFVEIESTGFVGDGLIVVDINNECYYIEDNITNNNTSYIRFKIVNNDHIELEQEKVYVKEYVKRAEGFANQSGIGGDIIGVYVP